MCEGSLSNLIVAGTLVVAITLCGFVRECQSDQVEVEDPTSEKGPFDCMRLMLRAGKRLMKMFSRCGREVKANSTSTKDYSEKMGCVMKCVMFYANMTTIDLAVTPDSLMSLMKQFLSSEIMIHEIHTSLMTACGKAAAKLDPTEDKCITYAEYVVCLQSGFEDFMNTSPYCMKRKKRPIQTED